jgi:putative hydrolase of the HAD superfamily
MGPGTEIVKMQNVRAVLFDLDNTLIDRDGAVGDWLLRTIDAPAVPMALKLDDNGYGDRDVFFSYLASCTGGTSDRAKSRFYEEILPFQRLNRGTSHLLDRIHGRIIIGIGSNGRTSMQMKKIAVTGLGKWTPEIIISESVGFKKPDPAFFDAACRILGVAREFTLMVGDHPINDIQGGKRAGLLTCWLRTPHYVAAPEADFIIDSLSELDIP